jgi:predicted DCC family thiol-disulfide oxidoreductase YuxK
VHRSREWVASLPVAGYPHRMSDLPPAAPVLLFDGQCLLCDGVVNFIVAHERSPMLRFSPLGSAFAARWLSAHPSLAGLDSVLLVEGERVFARSEAALRIARHLRWPWRGLAVLRVVPRFLRDALYDAVAARRQRWFGLKDACLRPARLSPARFVTD